MNPLSFENRVVIVTGAGGGLGRAYALDIAKRGGAVVVNDLGGSVKGEGASTSMADAVVAEIREAGGKAIANYDSVATMEGARRIAASAMEAYGRIDALINNAGNMRFADFEELTEEDLASLISVHLVGSFNITQAVWPVMKAQGYGRVVFTSSAAGMFGHKQMAAYGAAKGGVTGLMNVLSVEGKAHGILCNAVLPNALSRMTASVGASGTTEPNPYMRSILPTMQPEFMTGLAVYLASDVCQTTHSIYSSLGGRAARAFIGLTDGWYGSRETPSTAEDIAANIDTIRDVSAGFHIPESLPDEYRIVAEHIENNG